MYPYNYNSYQGSIYTPARDINDNDERFIGGFVGPLLLGGVAGYAIGQNSWNNYPRPMVFYPQQYYYPVFPRL